MSNTETIKTKITNIGRCVLAALSSINTGRRILAVYAALFITTFLLRASFDAFFYFYHQPIAETENVEVRHNECIEGSVVCSYPEAKMSEIDGNVELHLGECVEVRAQCSYRGTLKTSLASVIMGFYRLEVEGQTDIVFGKDYTSVIEHPAPNPDNN